MTEAEKSEVSRMHREGKPWTVIGRAFGVHPDTARRAVDPEYKRRRNDQVAKAREIQREGRASIIAIKEESAPPRLSALAESLGIRRVSRRIAIHTTVSSSGEGYATISLPHVSLIDGPREAAE